MVFYYTHRSDWYSMTVLASRPAIIAETAMIIAETEIADAIMTATMTTPSTHLLVFQGWVRCKPDGRANGARRQANMGPGQSAMRTRIRGTMSKPRVGPIFSGTRSSAQGTPSAFARAVAPSGAVAAKAVAVNREKSDRAIAADLGVGNPPRPAASAAVASVRPANDDADDSSRAAVTPPCARPPPATPPTKQFSS
jgi:hypothetical protein